MKTMNLKLLLLAGLVTVSFVTKTSAQEKGEGEIKYRRSSLHTMLVESDVFPHKETVLKAYYEAPFPDKYNNHTIGEKSFHPKDYPVTAEEMKAAGIKKTKNDVAKGKYPELPLTIEKYFEKNKIANKMVAKWFSRDSAGVFSMGLIGERGMYNASDMQANVAKGTARGASALADAGEELINNTFVVVSKLKFVSNEVAAAAIREIAKAAASQIPSAIFREAAILAADAVYNKTKEGYSVWTNAYLYQLQWNDSVAAVFYNDMWIDKSNIDAAKVAAFDNAEFFKFKYIGTEKASSLVTFSLKKGEGQRTEEQMIYLATVRNIDAVYAKLQKKYDVFKTKTPLYTGYPITAKIGMKEGLSGGEKFEVLEQSIDQKTGKTVYKKMGVIKVDKKLIWDNRFNAGEEAKDVLLDKEGKPIKYTTFKGGKKYYSGLLIKQMK